MIIINGTPFHGNNLSISNSKIFIDGKDISKKHDSKNITIEINGDLKSLDVDYCDAITVHGNVHELNSGSGNLNCGNITGDVKVGSGSIKVLNGGISGNVKTGSGDIKCGDVGGSIKTGSGDIKHRRK